MNTYFLDTDGHPPTLKLRRAGRFHGFVSFTMKKYEGFDADFSDRITRLTGFILPRSSEEDLTASSMRIIQRL
jgi:hypothetical protein